jgi:predicted dehydrogenase
MVDGESMKLLVVGDQGSIGKRRKMLLEEMGHTVKGVDLKSNSQFDSDMAEDFDAVFICLPPTQCVNAALDCVTAKVPFFLEKPGAVSSKDFHRLSAKLEKIDLVNMVCCNLRFTPEYKAIEEAIPNLGKPLFAYAEFGYFLPFWREGQYRTYYSAYRMAGGGILMDSIHEFDYLFSLFGYPDKPAALFATHENTKEMSELDAEDTANVFLLYKSGLNLVVHLDYLQRAYKRVFHAIGTKGRIDATFNVQGSNSMYKNEMKHFLECVKHGVETCKPVWQHMRLLEFVDKIRTPTIQQGE